MILINNLSSELFNNKLIFTDEKEVDTLIKNILKSKVINNEKMAHFNRPGVKHGL